MSRNQPRVTVIVFAFNEQDRVAESLKSVALQTVSVHALLYDNGSTDLTLQNMRSHALPNWSIHSHEHLPLKDSLLHAIEIGLRATTSEFFALLAGDDEWEPFLVKESVQFLESNPEISIAIPKIIWRESSGRNLRTLPSLELDNAVAVVRLLKASMSSYDHEIANVIYGVYRREAFESLREALLAGSMEEHGDDVSLAWEVLMHHRVASVPQNFSESALIRFDKGHDLGEQRLGLSQSANSGSLTRVAYNLRFWWRMHVSVTRALSKRPATRWCAPLAFTAGFPAELRHAIRAKLRPEESE